MDRRRLALASAVVALLAAGTAAAYFTLGHRDVTTSSKEAYRLYQKGLENEQKMYSREAVEAYAAALAHDPHFVMATLRLANALWGRDPERAKSLLQGAARYRDDVTERERLVLEMFEARFRRDSKGLEAAVDRYQARFPTDPDAYQMRAGILVKEGKTVEAAKVYEQLVKANPNYAIAYNNLGYYAMGTGDWARAEDYLKRYRFLAPDQANPFDSLGELYANTGRYAEARASLEQALKVKPDFSPSIAHLGTVAVGEGNLVEAAERYRAAAGLADGPESRFDWEFAQVFSLMWAGKFDDAAGALDRVAATVRQLPEAQQKSQETRLAFVRAALAAASGRLDDAERLLPVAEALVPKEGDEKGNWETAPFIVRAQIARARGDHAKAVEELAHVLKKADEPRKGGSFPYFPLDDLLRIDAADSDVKIGETAAAEKLLARILERNPKFQPALDAARRLGLAVPAPNLASR